MASYSAMLLVHLSVSLVKWSLATFRNLIPEGDTMIAAAPAPVLPRLCHNILAKEILVCCRLLEIGAPSNLPRNRPKSTIL
jgi:hypothetical protein